MTYLFKQPKVAILMATYNGADFLEKQLESIFQQTYQNWILYVSDDFSSDNTLCILEKFRSKAGPEKVIIIKGPRTGSSANFLSLLLNEQITADFFSFSDQDDIWLPNKIERAIGILLKGDRSIPALYGGRTMLINEKDVSIGFSHLNLKPPSFSNALLQCFAGGNTVLFNAPARKFLCKIKFSEKIISHEWLLYLTVTSVGGNVTYDEFPTVCYRQHSLNISGTNNTFFAKTKRLKYLIRGDFRKWMDQNILCLEYLMSDMTLDAKELLQNIVRARNSNFLTRLKIILNINVYRQSQIETILMKLAILFKRY